MSTTTPVPPELSTAPATGITVVGARENNLRGVDLALPKERLTVFTGVSGSGKSSLVFGTIAAESQRLINETYSAFVQGFMPTLARPEVDVLEGLTTAIIVDQERMGPNARSTVGTVTDANAMLRVLWSRLGQPRIGPASAFSFNVPSQQASGAVVYFGGMCPRCEGMGHVSDFDLTQLYDDSKSLAEGAITIPGYKVDSWWTVGIFTESGFLDPNKPMATIEEGGKPLPLGTGLAVQHEIDVDLTDVRAGSPDRVGPQERPDVVGHRPPGRVPAGVHCCADAPTCAVPNPREMLLRRPLRVIFDAQAQIKVL